MLKNAARVMDKICNGFDDDILIEKMKARGLVYKLF